MRNKIAFFLALCCLSWQLSAQTFVFPQEHQTVVIDTSQCVADFYWNCDDTPYMRIDASETCIITFDRDHLILWDYALGNEFQLVPTVKACLPTCPWHAVSKRTVAIYPSRASITRRE